jgi:choline dehydrogenase-like flavoprotein
VDLLPQTVVSKVVVDPDNGKVTGIEYKHYESISTPDHETGTIHGSIFVIAANAIENARLMLASGLPGNSGLMGRHLMDHPYLLTWGLLPENAGTMRGTVCTSGISDLRSGMFRKKHAGFAIDIHNDGWGWATGSPYSDLADLVDNKNKYGTDLRKELIGQLSRQLLLAFMIELLPEPGNRVTVDPSYTDSLGNMRPVISLDIPEYSLDAAVFGRELSKIIFQRTAAEDFSKYDPLDPGFVNYNGQGFALRGGNHIAGTHIMGTSSGNSVVTSKQRSWDHENLYIVGAGSMPSIGTSNTTLTLAAMCFMSTEAIINDLKQLKTVAENNVL